MDTPDTRPHPPTVGARALTRSALAALVLAAAACADPSASEPTAIVPRALRATPATAAVLPPAQTLQSGIDCSCSRTGVYRAPNPGKAIGAVREARSPANVYQATAVAVGTTITLRVSRGAVLVQDFPGLPTTASWGFSPDDDRLVVHFVDTVAGYATHHVALYNLAAAGAPLIVDYSRDPGPSTIAFSPKGRYFVFASGVGVDLSMLTIHDAATGASRLAQEFRDVPLTAPGWGFSPDAAERGFVFRASLLANGATWELLNLARPYPYANVRDAVVPAGGRPSFTPCGDVLGLAPGPNETQAPARLVRTVDGADVDSSARALPFGGDAFRATLADHLATLAGADQARLAANRAPLACPTIPSLTGLTLAPTNVQAGMISAGTLTLSGPAPVGGVTVTLASGNAAVASGPSEVAVPAGSTSATFTVQTGAVAVPTTVSISGTLLATRTAALTVSPPPRIAVAPAALAFGDQPVGTTSGAQAVSVTNVGAVPATIAAIATSGDFARTTTCPIAPATLAAGASCTIGVTFSPTTAGARAGQLTVSSDATGSPHVVSLSGAGTVPAASVTPASLGFGSLRVGTTSSLGKTVTLTNVGRAPLVVAAVSVAGAPMDFDVRSDGCTGVAVSPGASCALTLGFEPSAVGTRSAVLTIAHNAPGGPSTVALSGTGVAGPGGHAP